MLLSSRAAPMSLRRKVTWAEAIPGDVMAAVIAGAAAAPIVSNVDRAIAENSSGRAKLWTSFFTSCRQMVLSPMTYLRQPAFYYLWAMYAGTYMVANSFTSAEERHWREPKPTAKTFTIFGVNAGLTLIKDRAFAQIFGTKMPEAVPAVSYASWFARDFLSMGVIFVAPPIVAAKISATTGIDKYVAQDVAQISLPVMLQPITTPLHLLGYVAYNEPAASWTAHSAAIRKMLFDSMVIRCIRIFPPYSVGTLLNKKLRSQFQKQSHLVRTKSIMTLTEEEELGDDHYDH